MRVFGFGVAVYAPWKIPFFSERYGYRRMLRLGRWRVEWLPRWS